VTEDPGNGRQRLAGYSPVNTVIGILQYLPPDLIPPRTGHAELAPFKGVVSIVATRIAQTEVRVGYPRVLEDGPAVVTLTIRELAWDTVKEIRSDELNLIPRARADWTAAEGLQPQR
jgi:hypothetical protein